MKEKFLSLRFLIIILITIFCHKAFGFEKFNLNDIDPNENIIVEDMFEPLKVTGDQESEPQNWFPVFFLLQVMVA